MKAKGQFGQDTVVSPLVFMRSSMGFLMTTGKSEPRFNVSFKGIYCACCIVSLLLYWGIRTHAEHRVSTPCRPHYHQQQPGFPWRTPIQVPTLLNPAQLQWAISLWVQADNRSLQDSIIMKQLRLLDTTGIVSMGTEYVGTFN